VGEHNLQFYHTTTNAEESWPRIWEEAKMLPQEQASGE
jgi:hypothetical protein